MPTAAKVTSEVEVIAPKKEVQLKLIECGPRGDDVVYKKPHLVSLMKSDFNLAELKLITALMFLANQQQQKDPSQKKFFSNIADVSAISGVQYSNTKLKGMVLGMQAKPVVLNFIGKHGARQESGGLISWAAIEDNNPIIEYEFPETIVKSLNEPDYYTLIHMISMRYISSRYTSIIYDFCKSYIGLGRTKILSIDEFREFLNLKESYSNFANIERRVLLPAKMEICDSDKIEIVIDYEVTKVGKRVDAIQFTVKMKDKQIYEQLTTLDKIMMLVPEQCRTEKLRGTFQTWLSRKGSEYCIAAVQYTYTHVKQDRSFSTYLSKSLTQDWHGEVQKRRMIEKEVADIEGVPINIQDMDPEADIIYMKKYEDAGDRFKSVVKFEIAKRIRSGRIRKIMPHSMQVRMAMQYLERDNE